ncbi:hypothetical protein DFJ73DRAFT_779112 [Zopfochytrium polystomum]|nr:hypothetical protein DFJ73DRAFT_779112 [Zopfochytrium polystomum]
MPVGSPELLEKARGSTALGEVIPEYKLPSFQRWAQMELSSMIGRLGSGDFSLAKLPVAERRIKPSYEDLNDSVQRILLAAAENIGAPQNAIRVEGDMNGASVIGKTGAAETTRLIIDVTSNGGSDICFGQAIIRYLFKSAKVVRVMYDVRATKMLSDLIRMKAHLSLPEFDFSALLDDKGKRSFQTADDPFSSGQPFQPLSFEGGRISSFNSLLRQIQYILSASNTSSSSSSSSIFPSAVSLRAKSRGSVIVRLH